MEIARLPCFTRFCLSPRGAQDDGRREWPARRGPGHGIINLPTNFKGQA